MQDLLIVVDMQNDFIDGALGTDEAVKIVPDVIEKVKNFKGEILFTRDTHYENYLSTQEGTNLPIKHCIYNTQGWEICNGLKGYVKNQPIDKLTFGSEKLGEILKAYDGKDRVKSVTVIGLCTDVCVISNALIAKAFLPEAEIIVDAKCCAGITPQGHKTALDAMKICQIKIENE